MPTVECLHCGASTEAALPPLTPDSVVKCACGSVLLYADHLDGSGLVGVVAPMAKLTVDGEVASTWGAA